MQINGYGAYKSAAAYREAAKWGETPKIQNKAQATVEKAMTDSFIEKTKQMAREDAKKGIYMDKEFSQFRRSHMEKYVSPDRSGPMAQVSNIINKALNDYDPILSLLDTMLGNYSVKGRITPESQTAEIYSPDGEMIAAYNSLGGGWHRVGTEAESKFMGEAAAVYLQAFREARAEMKAAAAAPAQGGGAAADTGSLNIRV